MSTLSTPGSVTVTAPSYLPTMGTYSPSMSTNTDMSTNIDMLKPEEVCDQLALSFDALLSAVNSGELAAYDLGEGVRFRAVEVSLLAAELLSA